MLRQQTDKNVAIYCRLSKDDGTNTESSSIGTQKQMLLDYVKANNLGNPIPYIDDGYSGKNFNRPAFKRMVEDIENGKISTCVTKDLSRLGRNYIETGMYIEMFFPDNDVRFIAIADGIDTDNNTSSLDIAPFKNILNDMYLKDISKKIRMARKTRFNQGKFMGNIAPYGYLKDPDDKNHLIIDENYAPTVRRIFNLCKSGIGISKIRQTLTEEKIIRPSARNDVSIDENSYTWSNTSVRTILQNQVYIGHLVGYKRVSKGIKNDKRVLLPKEDWQVVYNTHEPIISLEDFELVQKLMVSRRKTVDCNSGYDNIFSGLVKCDTCGKSLRTRKTSRKPRENAIEHMIYVCNNYATYGINFCTQHKIEATDLYNVVLEDIKKHSKMATINTDKLIANVLSNKDSTQKDEIKRQKKELKQSQKRLQEVDNLFAKLFENNVNGKISERNYLAMSKKYEIEQAELEIKIPELQDLLSKENETNDNAQLWVEEIKKHIDIQELNAPLLNSLIDKITVTEKEVINGEKHQTVNIYYKFIGCVG